MEGFFTKQELEKFTRIESTVPKEPQCFECGLSKGCKHPKMEYTGEGRLKCLIIAEGPGCISGDSLIDTAFRNKSIFPNGIPIRSLVGKKDFYVYSFYVNQQKIVIGKVKKVWKTGKKKIYEVKYLWKFAKKKKNIELINILKVSSNHQFLLKRPIPHDPFKGINNGTIYIQMGSNDA